MTEKSGPKQARGRFKPGQSGNPAGKPKGTRNRVTLLAERLMIADAEGVVRAVIDAAKGGDVAAAKVVLDRIAPVQKDRTAFRLRGLATAADASAAMGDVIAAVAAGTISPGEGEAVARIISAFVAALEISDFEQRLSRLELRVAA
jgi:hypothetical protein